MSLARKIFSNTAWQIAGKIITAGLGIVSIKFITNYLSPSTYGEYTIIYDFTAYFAIIADFGLFTIAIREMAHGQNIENTLRAHGASAQRDSQSGSASCEAKRALSKDAIARIVGNVLSIRSVLAVGSLGLGILAASLIPVYDGTHIPYGVAIVSAATIITLIAGTMSSVLQFYLRMHAASIALSVGKAVTVVYILFTILFLFPNNPNAGFAHLLFAWIIGGLVTIFITYRASAKLIPIQFNFDICFWKEIFAKALPYGLALVLGTVYFRMGTITLSLLEMNEQAGFWGVPMRFVEILQIIPHYFMNSVLPILTIALAADMAKAKRILRYSLNALTAIAFPTLIGGVLVAWPLTAAISSPEFLTRRTAEGLVFGSDFGLKILLVAVTFTYLHVALSYCLVAMNRQKELLWINGVVVVINVILNIILTPRFGFIGAAITAVASECVMFLLLFVRVRSRIRGVWDFVFIGKTLLSASLMGTVLFFVSPILNAMFFSKSLMILIPLGGIVFALSMWLTRAIGPEMLSLLKKRAPVQEE